METRSLNQGDGAPRLPAPAASGPAPRPTEPGTDALAGAGRDFERLLVEQMLVSMQASLEEGLFAREGVSREWYTSLFNEEMSKEMTAGAGLGLASSLLAQLRREEGATAAQPGLERALAELGALPSGQEWAVQGLASLDRAFALRRREREQAALDPLAALGHSAELGRAARPSFRRPDSARVSELRELAVEVAREVGVEPRLAMALVETESGWDERARSRKGAMGLTQLMPDTARGLGVRDPFDPRQNLKGGLRYLRQMLERYEDRQLALAAYNAGPGAVDRAGGIPPYAETRAYVAKIEQLMGRTP
jgi:soluble lytic murein transglycosylase-like protein